MHYLFEAGGRFARIIRLLVRGFLSPVPRLNFGAPPPNPGNCGAGTGCGAAAGACVPNAKAGLDCCGGCICCCGGWDGTDPNMFDAAAAGGCNAVPKGKVLLVVAGFVELVVWLEDPKEKEGAGAPPIAPPIALPIAGGATGVGAAAPKVKDPFDAG